MTGRIGFALAGALALGVVSSGAAAESGGGEVAERAASAMAALARSAEAEPQCRRREIVLGRDASAGVPEITVAGGFVTAVNILDGRGEPRRIGEIQHTGWLWARSIGHVLTLGPENPHGGTFVRDSSVAVLLGDFEEHPEVVVLASKVGGEAVDCWVDLRLAAE